MRVRVHVSCKAHGKATSVVMRCCEHGQRRDSRARCETGTRQEMGVIKNTTHKTNLNKVNNNQHKVIK